MQTTLPLAHAETFASCNSHQAIHDAHVGIDREAMPEAERRVLSEVVRAAVERVVRMIREERR